MRSRQCMALWAQRKTRANNRAWLALPDFGRDLEFSFPTQPPTEQQALVDPDEVASWVRDWRSLRESSGVRIEWTRRTWSSLGLQSLPARVKVHGTTALNEIAGQARAWRDLCDKADHLVAGLGEAVRAGLRPIATKLAGTDPDDVGRLVAVVRWLVAHPDSGLSQRELPVVAADSKWLERHRKLVTPLVEALTGSRDLGLTRDRRSFAVRILDRDLTHPPYDFTATVPQLAELELHPSAVLISENLAPLRRLGVLPGVVAIHGGGVDVVELADVPWVTATPVWYWGDLDSHGLRILGSARKVLPQVRSLLMDLETLHQFQRFAVPEPTPYRGTVGYLNAAESLVLDELRQADLRLEQERIDWGYAWEQIMAAVGSGGGEVELLGEIATEN